MTVICLSVNEAGGHIAEPSAFERLPHLVRARSVPELLFFVRNRSCSAVVISCAAPSTRTDDLLLEIRRTDSGVPVIFNCKSASTSDIIRLVRLGAHHVWNDEQDAGTILSDLQRACEMSAEQRSARERESGNEEPWRKSIVGNSEGMQRMLDIIRLVAARRSSVLITGETGTGKEVVARAIHNAGGRGHLPFVAVNCNAIPANLIESELFGYVKGAFTGAAQSRPGKFEQANGGTILLDEIGDLPVELQVKLLRVLQEREIQRLGGSETIRLNIRVIAATNIDLERAIQQKTFREDLYYRLNVVPVHIPALRERRSDIPALADHFITRVCAAEGVSRKKLTNAALDRLKDYSWPGNVRQLEHAIEMAVILSGDRSLLDVADFPVLQPASAIAQAAGLADVQLSETGLDFEETVSQLEWSLIQQALAMCQGNKARAAELLRMKRTTLLARVRSLESRRQPAVLGACA